jgi:hypothetical protein
MRYFALVMGTALLAGCPGKQVTPPPPPPAPGGPTACLSQPNTLPDVLIVVDPTVPAPNQIRPKDCYVTQKAKMTWREEHNTPFKLVFDKTPEEGGEKEFQSKSVGAYQEVTLKAKFVAARDTIPYNAFVGATKLDPTVIIDP